VHYCAHLGWTFTRLVAGTLLSRSYSRYDSCKARPFEWAATVVSSFEFIFPGPFTPGAHTIKVQWRAEGDIPEDFPQWGARTVTVTY
jgi:hypothetical protein